MSGLSGMLCLSFFGWVLVEPEEAVGWAISQVALVASVLFYYGGRKDVLA